MLRLALLLAVLARVALATPLWLDGCEDVTSDSGTAADTFLLLESATTDTKMLVTTSRPNDDSNTGEATSKWACYANASSGDSIYYAPDPRGVTLNHSQLAWGANVHVIGLPAAAREIVEFRMGSDKGCFLQVKTDGTLGVYYNTTGTTFGSSTTALGPNACVSKASVPCTGGGQCDGSGCGTCNTTTGAQCYYAGLELVQVNYPSGASGSASCSLWVDGRQEVTGAVTAVGVLSNVTDVRFGAPAGEASALQIQFDGLVLDDSDRAGRGWVGSLTPTADGSLTQWLYTSCNTGDDYSCVADWAAGGQYSSLSTNDTVRARSAGQREEFYRFSAIALGQATVSAVARVMAGRTSNDNQTWTLQHSTLTCPTATTCQATTAASTTLVKNTSHYLLGLGLDTQAPNTSDRTWSAANLAQIGVRLATGSPFPSNTDFRVGGLLLYVRGQLADDLPPKTLKDRTGDGLVTVCAVGDSLDGGTLSAACPAAATNAGDLCSQNTYCANIHPETKDRPTGGCTSDTDCKTCTLRRDEANGGAGYQCDGSITLCGTAGTCNTTNGTCNDNVNVPCAIDADCTGLGSCETSGTCVYSCLPSVACPAHAGWGAYLKGKINVDNLVSFSLGGERALTMAVNRAAGIIAGNDSNGAARQGTGQCTCSTNGHCGSGGTCASGKCTAGDLARTACTSALDCDTGSSQVCAFPPCDYIVALEGINDTIEGTFPECSEIPSAGSWQDAGSICASNCTGALSTRYCSADSDCAAVSASSVCVGLAAASDTDAACFQYKGGGCTAEFKACRSSADCTGWGTPTCTVSAPTSIPWAGKCTCNANADCPVGFGDTAATWKCQSGACRRRATVASTCSPGAIAARYDAGNSICKGVCSCPCDARACTKDADCDRQLTSYWGTVLPAPVTFAGKCTANKCDECGFDRCSTDATTHPIPFSNYHRLLTAAGMVPAFREFQRRIDALLGAAATHPLLLVNTMPEFGFTDPCRPALNILEAVWSDAYGEGYSRRLKAEFPHVIETRRAYGRDPNRYGRFVPYHSDAVHFLPAGASAIAAIQAQYLNTLNACATTDAYGDPIVQKYCVVNATSARATAGNCPSAPDTTNCTCTTTAQCASGQTCLSLGCAADGDCPGSGDTCRLE